MLRTESFEYAVQEQLTPKPHKQFTGEDRGWNDDQSDEIGCKQ
jgi:hypothetical protein